MPSIKTGGIAAAGGRGEVRAHRNWPPDFDDNQTIDIIDGLALKPVFGESCTQGTWFRRSCYESLSMSGSGGPAS